MLFRICISILVISINFCFTEEVTIVLTGTSEIGQEIIKTISEKNRKILALGRNQNKLEKLSQKYDCRIFQMDFANDNCLINFSEYLKKENIDISGFVIITPRPTFSNETLPSENSWFEMFRICYTRPLEFLKISIPYFSQNAQLVILSGVTSVQALPEYASYGILRKMWLAEAKSLAWELGAKGITVNTVSPGLVMTSSHLNKWQKEANSRNIQIDELLAEKVKNYPSRKISTKKDVAEAVYFFLSGVSNITGQNLVVDGGLSQVY